MDHSIVCPPNPYLGTLRVFPGTLVKVSGRPTPNATRFSINFRTGPSLDPPDDLALQLSPCFTPPRVVRNSLIQGAWGIEELSSNGSIVSPHSPVEITILAENEQFKIAINGSHYCEFRHRIPYQQITHLAIDGDIDIERITITSPEYRSQPAYQPSGFPTAPMPTSATYASSGGMSMPEPTPAVYPSLGPEQPPSHYPTAPAGPAPAPASYSTGYPQDGAGSSPSGSELGPTRPPSGGPAPAPASYASDNPQGGPKPAPSGSGPDPAMPPEGGPAPAPSGYYGGKALGSIAAELMSKGEKVDKKFLFI